MHASIRILAATAALVCASTAFAHEYRLGDIVINHPWTRATSPAAKVGGGYLVAVNNGTVADRLVGASSRAAARVEIHNMTMDNGVMKMRPVPEGMAIPTNGEIELAPGGYHFMLIDLTKPVKEGDRVPVTLQFEKAGSIEVEFIAGALGQAQSDHRGGPSATHDGEN
ncbi:MAG: copper chaperone PCu(A)C [Rhizobiaceae bacterium]|nr:copper chaperone PCu(A)C [Rhizobiaceae bacterium]